MEREEKGRSKRWSRRVEEKQQHPFSSKVQTILFGAFAGTGFVLLEFSRGNNNLFCRGPWKYPKDQPQITACTRCFTVLFHRLLSCSSPSNSVSFLPFTLRSVSPFTSLVHHFFPFPQALRYFADVESRSDIVSAINRLVKLRTRGCTENGSFNISFDGYCSELTSTKLLTLR